MVKAKKWTLVKVFDGEPKPSDLRLDEEEIPDSLQDGEILVEAVYLSVDPYMRAHRSELKDNMTMFGEQVAKVIASKSSKYPVGSLVNTYAGWRTHTVIKDDAPMLRPTPSLGSLSPSVALGILGMPGATAYFGLLELCHPKEGEVVLVNGAAGAVGSAVGQIAKIKGCTVIGFAGTKDKCDWLKELGFDHVFNYREDDVSESLQKAAPDGIDCYFDNVGGDFTNKALPHMKTFGRVSICGAISTYNEKSVQPLIPSPFMLILGKQLRVEGFIVTRWLQKWPECFKDMGRWIQEGRLKFKETVTNGFDKMPEAFFSLFKGGNTGKAIVKA